MKTFTEMVQTIQVFSHEDLVENGDFIIKAGHDVFYGDKPETKLILIDKYAREMMQIHHKSKGSATVMRSYISYFENMATYYLLLYLFDKATSDEM